MKKNPVGKIEVFPPPDDFSHSSITAEERDYSWEIAWDGGSFEIFDFSNEW